MTSILNRFLLIAVAVLMAVGAGEYLALRGTRAQLQAASTKLEAAQRTLKSTNAALRTRSKALQAAQASIASARKDLDHALQENPGWAGTAVPDAVWSRLYGDAASSPAP